LNPFLFGIFCNDVSPVVYFYFFCLLFLWCYYECNTMWSSVCVCYILFLLCNKINKQINKNNFLPRFKMDSVWVLSVLSTVCIEIWQYAHLHLHVTRSCDHNMVHNIKQSMWCENNIATVVYAAHFGRTSTVRGLQTALLHKQYINCRTIIESVIPSGRKQWKSTVSVVRRMWCWMKVMSSLPSHSENMCWTVKPADRNSFGVKTKHKANTI